MKLLEENKEKFHDIGFGISFLDMVPETQAAKATEGPRQAKKFLYSKGNNSIKMQPMKQKKMSAYTRSDKRSIPKTYKEHLQLNSKKVMIA